MDTSSLLTHYLAIALASTPLRDCADPCPVVVAVATNSIVSCLSLLALFTCLLRTLTPLAFLFV